MRIYYIIGKSCSGKTTIYNKLISDKDLNLNPIITYTTRPIRTGEKDGVEYHFIDDAKANKLVNSGKVIEERSYITEYGRWRYMTVDDGQFNKDKKYIGIGTVYSYNSMYNVFGDSMIPIVLISSAETILKRAVSRLDENDYKGYKEICRRYLEDATDYGEDMIRSITDRSCNGLESDDFIFRNDDETHEVALLRIKDLIKRT